MPPEGTVDGTAAATSTGDAAAAAAALATQTKEATPAAKSPAAGEAKSALTELVGDDTDTRDWLTKQAERVKDIPSLAKLAREQDKMIGEQAKKLGDAVRLPGKDATQEEIDAYKAKLDIPKDATGYEFKAPEKLPEGLPYDGDRAKAFAAKAAELGLSKKQAQGLHDWVSDNAVSDFNAVGTARSAQQLETAKAETAKLIEEWGPLTGEKFRANAMFADKALMEVGGQTVLDALTKAGMIGQEQGVKVIQNADVAKMFAKFGQAIYSEDKVLRGNPDRLNNPFTEGPNFNLTKAMALVKSDRDAALTLIAAAGKKPGDFGLK